ncbi:MAG: nitrate- and nitrite sensing domain-containing protein [Cyclobacteriaceae bacterium]
MKSLHNLSIRQKFALVIIPLIIVLVCFDYFQIKHNYLDHKDATRLNKAITIGIEINHVVHEIQKERGATSGFLANEGEDFVEKLNAQRDRTDSTLQAYYSNITAPDLEDLRSLHEEDINFLKEAFDALIGLRATIDNHSVTAGQAIAQFSQINEIALNTVNLLINETRDRAVAQQVHAIIYFLKSKELASIERAIGTQAFSMNHLGFDMYHQVADLVASQDSYIDAFLTITNEESKKYYNEVVQGQAVAEVDRLRTVLFENDVLVDDPNYWYDVITQKINLLKNVEDFMSERIHNYTETLAADSNRDFWMFLIIDIVISILDLMLMGYIVAHFIGNIRTLKEFTEQYSEGDLNHKVKIDSTDEIGQYANTFNNMLDEINTTHQALKKERDQAEFLYENIYKQSEVVFEHVQQGIFLLDADYKISTLYSKAMEDIFDNTNIGGESFVNFMRPRVIPRDLEALEMFIMHLFNVEIEEDVVNQLNPVEQVKIFTEKDNVVTTKYIRIQFTRIQRGDEIQNIMVTVLDETESILLQKHIEEAEEKKKMETEQMLSILKIDPSILRGFLHNTRKILKGISERYEQDDKSDFSELLTFTFQTVHNLKGNSSAIGLQLVTDKFHDIEESITRIRNKEIKGNDFLKILYEINEIDQILMGMTDMLKKVASVYKKFSTEGEIDSDINIISSLERGLYLMSEDSGKSIEFIFENENDLTIPDAYKDPIKDVMIQLIRNSIAHGIETPHERTEADKPVQGSIKISLEQGKADKKMVISYRDDGKGLDLEAIKAKALEKKLITPSKAERLDRAGVMDLIFMDGFSSAEEVDEIAGRGQGMSLVKTILKELDGDYTIDSETGKYFELVFKLPFIKLDNLEE